MGLGRVLTVVRSASRDERSLYAETVLALARAAADLRFRRFRALVGGLEQVDGNAPPPPVDQARAAEAERIAQAVRRCARNVPWEALCLCQALALTRMLRRRGIAGQVTLGSRLSADDVDEKDDGGDGTGRSLTAHAWLSSGRGVLLGGERSPEVYTGLVSYRWKGH